MNTRYDQLQIENLHRQFEPFEAFKRQALQSMMWGCVGFFLLGIMVGLMLTR